MYLAAVKLDQMGKPMKDPMVLDTTDVNFFANTTSRLYSVLNSENKEFISIIKINSKRDDTHFVGNVLLDKNLQRISKTRVGISMPERNDFLTQFTLDNDGDLVFVQASGANSNDNINKIVLCIQPKGSNTVNFFNPGLKDVFLDDVKVKVNNANKQYLVSSFYSKNRRGAIEGLYTALFAKDNSLFTLNRLAAFSEAFRGEAKGENGMKNAFDDYFLQHIIMRKDGGFLVTAEANYQTTRGNTFSRWDYLNSSPFWSPSDYYMWRSYGYTAPWWRYYGGGNTSATTRYFADNIAIISFNKNGDMEWNGVINKSQFDDNSDNTLR
jgi:hypothetical protein